MKTNGISPILSCIHPEQTNTYHSVSHRKSILKTTGPMTMPPSLLEGIQKAFKEGTVVKTKKGKNGALFLESCDGKILAVIKLKQNELGSAVSPLASERTNGSEEPIALASKPGIEPGEGAFSEYLTAFVMSEWLEKTDIESDQILIPSVVWGEIAHAEIDGPHCLIAQEGCLHAFAPQSTSFNKDIESLYASNLTEAIQMLAIMDMALINADRNSENFLLQKNQKNTTCIIPIDHACILPRNGIAPMFPCWKNLPQIKQPLTKKSRQFILEHLTENTLKTQLLKINTSEAQNFDPDRIKAHKIAIELLKAGVQNDLTLRDILGLFMQLDHFETPAIHQILQTNTDINTISQLCKRLVATYKTQVQSSRERNPNLPDNDLYQEALERALSYHL